MGPAVTELESTHSPESLVAKLAGEPGVVLLRSGFYDSPQARYSFVAARPFLTFRSIGSRCEISSETSSQVHFGNPWRVLDSLMLRYELLDEMDLPFPLGGCFGYWGYDLKNFVEPKLARRSINDLDLPDCHVGFYDSLAVFDHRAGKIWIVSTGLQKDGSRDENAAQERLHFWRTRFNHDEDAFRSEVKQGFDSFDSMERFPPEVSSNLSRAEFISKVQQAQQYIRSGDIYQVNLSQRLATKSKLSGWDFFQRLTTVSPAPFSAYLDCGEFQIASSSPELFLRLSGSQIETRPIKGTRPRSPDSTHDAQLTYELQTNPKEISELVMITDLLRNDLGKICEYGSVQVPELLRLERYAQVQHLVSTIKGCLRKDVSHFAGFASCFPGGSISGAPKIRAMEIIDELEPIARGPYTGAIGYLGLNRESQVSIAIRMAVCKEQSIYFNVGAGIVADSIPEMEYEETLVKARGFFLALGLESPAALSPQPIFP